MELNPLSDDAVVLAWDGTAAGEALGEVRAVVAAIEADPPAGLVAVVPAYATVTVFYDLTRIGSFDGFCRDLQERAGRSVPRAVAKGQLISIPVCYGGECGPDLMTVARHSGLAAREVAELHAAETYVVGAIGFSPGFPYLVGLPAKLHTPRRSTPRTQVPAGSVAIGGGQTGVYPVASPGGWNLIGRTPLKLFDPSAEEPTQLRVGDRLRFKAITAEEFATWQ
ncbi:MAG: hypothetical protein RIS54_878 [Verrucomicrobiota bacterium]|jgi:inhibitor of KinA